MIRSIIQHLRFPFSLLLLPVFLFSLVELKNENILYQHIILLFFILHLLVYPSSNAYNSLQDQDEGSIGLIKKPLPAPKELLWLTVLMDTLAVLSATAINMFAALGILIYILFSRLYSYRKIRLKKFAVIGFLTVFIFQGFWIYLLVHISLGSNIDLNDILLGICSSCLIGAIYPLSQIYQHRQDLADGVVSLSSRLGYKGTFVFSGILFLTGSGIYTWIHIIDHQMLWVFIFMICQLPVILYFLYWFNKVWHDNTFADYTNTMRMNIIASICMNSCFIILYLVR